MNTVHYLTSPNVPPFYFTHRDLLLIVLFTIPQYTGHADLSISTSTPTPCYGDVVTLVCHHPEVASNPGKYFTITPAWRENGTNIAPSTAAGIYLQTDTSKDHTRTTLTINITVDHFRNGLFNYSCLLALAENGLPTGEVETSPEVTIDPVGEWAVHVYMQFGTHYTHNIIVDM